MTQSKDEIVLKYEDNLIRESDLLLLEDAQEWLNDNIISFWFAYLQNKFTSNTKTYCCVCPEMTQFFKSAQQYKTMYQELEQILNNEQYANKDLFFIPINDCDFIESGGSHWSLLVFYKETSQGPRAEHYDSTKSFNIQQARIVANILNQIINSAKGDWIDVIEMNCISQVNGYDCGIHLLCNVEALIHILILDEDASLMELASLKKIESKRKEIKNTIFKLKSTNS